MQQRCTTGRTAMGPSCRASPRTGGTGQVQRAAEWGRCYGLGQPTVPTVMGKPRGLTRLQYQFQKAVHLALCNGKSMHKNPNPLVDVRGTPLEKQPTEREVLAETVQARL